MPDLFFWLALLLAISDWLAVYSGWKRLHWVAKPGMMVALILWFTLAGRWAGPLAAIGLGLVLSLLGDVFLLLPSRFFMAGMASFFLTHLFYIYGFNQQPLSISWGAVLPVLVVTGSFAYLNRRFRYGLMRRSNGALLVPMIIYGVILSLMWLAALTTLFRTGWEAAAAIMVSLGGTLFFISDAFCVYHRFIVRLRSGDLIVMGTYHLAQIMIAGGTLEQFLI